MTVIVINESLFTDAKQQDAGITTGNVLNGAYGIQIDWTNRIYWSNAYPDSKYPIKSVRPAVKGECHPYY